MRNILVLISRDDKKIGGSEEVLRLIANYYIAHGDNVHIFFLKEKMGGYWESVKHPNLFLYYSQGMGKFGIFSVIKNFRYVKNIFFDYSYSCIVLENAIIGILKRLGIVQIKHMIVRESTLVFQRFKGGQLLWRKLLYKIGYTPATLIICQTHKMKEDLLYNLPVLKNKLVKVIPNPVDIELINNKSKEHIELNKFGDFVVTAGRLIEEKGFDILINSFASINNTSLNLLILGDGYAKGALLKQIKQLGLERRVILYGQVPNVYPYFKKAILCVVSSRVEGFPNVLLQMMSQNVNVVCTRCFDENYNLDGVYMCNPNDSSSLSKVMLKCLERDNSSNRVLFDTQLDNVSIGNFIRTVESYCRY